jgi:hypothetical protein
MRVPIRPLTDRWPGWLEVRALRFFWADPRVLIERMPTAEQFRTAVSAMNFGGTIKITGSNRHPGADALLVDNVDVSGKIVIDIGASDGSTSLDLIRRLPDFKAYIIADLFLHMKARKSGSRVLFYDNDDACVLVSGSRFVAWPSLSKLVRTIYWPVITHAAQQAEAPLEVLLLNPDVRELMASDDRVTYRVHDVFAPWQGEQPDAIKVANLLRRLYFSDEQIANALEALLASLKDGGHLLIVDNSRIPNMVSRGGLYQRVRDHFELVAGTPDVHEIADLVIATRL